MKLVTTPTQAERLRKTAQVSRDALNYTSQVADEQGKLSNAARLQPLVYREVQGRCGLSAQLACPVPRQVAAPEKGLWTNVRQNIAHRARGFTKKRDHGLDRAPTFVALTTSFSHGYDDDSRFKAAPHVSLTTLDGRLVLPYQGYTPHSAYIQAGRHVAPEQQACQRQPSPPPAEQDRADHERPRDQALLAPLAWPGEEKRTEPTEEERPPVSRGGDLPPGVTLVSPSEQPNSGVILARHSGTWSSPSVSRCPRCATPIFAV